MSEGDVYNSWLETNSHAPAQAAEGSIVRTILKFRNRPLLFFFPDHSAAAPVHSRTDTPIMFPPDPELVLYHRAIHLRRSFCWWWVYGCLLVATDPLHHSNVLPYVNERGDRLVAPCCNIALA